MPDIVLHGASGFIGKHLARKLDDNNFPFIIVARNSSKIQHYRNGKIFRYSKSVLELIPFLNHLNFPIYIELAWNGVFGTERNHPLQITSNVPMILDSIEIAAILKCSHWIGLGSQAEYGNLDKKINENDHCNPTTLYGKSKLICSNISNALCSAYDIKYSWLRLFSVYGPDDNHQWLIQYLINKMLNNENIEVTKAEQLWDYLYIDDITEMFLKLIKSEGLGKVNLASGTAIPVKEIILMLKKQTHSKSVINFGAIPYRDDQVMVMQADITKISKSLNWFPKIGLEEGLMKTIESIKSKNKYNTQ